MRKINATLAKIMSVVLFFLTLPYLLVYADCDCNYNKIIAQRDEKETTMNKVVGNRVFHPGGGAYRYCAESR